MGGECLTSLTVVLLLISCAGKSMKLTQPSLTPQPPWLRWDLDNPCPSPVDSRRGSVWILHHLFFFVDCRGSLGSFFILRVVLTSSSRLEQEVLGTDQSGFGFNDNSKATQHHAFPRVRLVSSYTDRTTKRLAWRQRAREAPRVPRVRLFQTTVQCEGLARTR